jgi:hypothetical protein
VEESGGAIMAAPTSGVVRLQGWKLHISASIRSAEEILRRSLPILMSEEAAFKVVSSLGALNEINHGRAGISQVGKFITIYPRDDDQAVRLAIAIDEATTGLESPSIPSDRRLSRKSVHAFGKVIGEGVTSIGLRLSH